MGEVRRPAEQVSVVAAWSVAGPEFVPVTILDAPAAYTVGWEEGDVLVTQGDSHIEVNRRGQIEESVRALATDLC